MPVIRFRDSNDKLHFFLCAIITVLLMPVFLYRFSGNSAELSTLPVWLLSYVCAFVSTNIIGVLFELAEHFILPRWDSDWWERRGLKGSLLHRHFSGDTWDSVDISLNFFGSTVFYPVILLVADLLNSRKQKK